MIVADELMKTYPGEVRVVRGVSFSVSAGDGGALAVVSGYAVAATVAALRTSTRRGVR